MSEEIFIQTIFPPTVKEVKMSNSLNDICKDDSMYSVMTDGLYCNIKKDWISFYECVGCKKGTRTLEEIMVDNVGCW